MSEEPAFRVTRGLPTHEELAAIVGVLWSRREAASAAATSAAVSAAATSAAVSAAATSAATTAARTAVSRWRASAAPRFGRLPRPAAGAWLDTVRPHDR